MTVDLQRSDDGGSHWRTLARGLPGTSYAYTVTAPWTTTARIRVVDSHAAQFADASDADFTVQEPIQVGVGNDHPVLALLGAWPNPARRDLSVSLSLPAGDARGALELIDLLGRRVGFRDLAGLPLGRRETRSRARRSPRRARCVFGRGQENPCAPAHRVYLFVPPHTYASVPEASRVAYEPAHDDRPAAEWPPLLEPGGAGGRARPRRHRRCPGDAVARSAKPRGGEALGRGRQQLVRAAHARDRDARPWPAAPRSQELRERDACGAEPGDREDAAGSRERGRARDRLDRLRRAHGHRGRRRHGTVHPRRRALGPPLPEAPGRALRPRGLEPDVARPDGGGQVTAPVVAPATVPG